MKRVGLLLLWVPILLAACTSSAANLTPDHTPTSTAPATLLPSPTPTLTPAPTATVTPTPAPTLSPAAITAANVTSLQMVLVLADQNGAVYGVAVSGDGSLIATASVDRLVRVYDGATGDLLHTLERHTSGVATVAMSPDGSRLASGGVDRTVQLWDPRSGERIGGQRISAEPSQLVFSPEGDRFAGVGYYSAVGHIWEAGGGGPLGEIGGHNTRLRSVAWSPDGRWIVSGDGDGVVVLHDANSGETIFTLNAVTDAAEAVAISPDGNQLAVGSGRGVIALYDTATQMLTASWGVHSGQVTSLTYSPDGSLLISAGLDEAIRFWDAPGAQGTYTGASVRDIRLAAYGGHGAPVRSIAISRDGSTLVSGGDDWRALVWRIGG